MIINVTLDDIAAGKQHHPSECPVALAVKRHLPYPVRVSNRDVTLELRPNQWWVCNTPNEVFDFIDCFDAECVAHPFTFELGETSPGVFK